MNLGQLVVFATLALAGLSFCYNVHQGIRGAVKEAKHRLPPAEEEELRRLRRNQFWLALVSAVVCLMLAVIASLPMVGKDRVSLTQVVHNEGSAALLPILLVFVIAWGLLAVLSFRAWLRLGSAVDVASRQAADYRDAVAGRWFKNP